MKVTVMRGAAGDGTVLQPQVFEIPDLPGASVSNVLQYINRYLDGSVAYYLSCRRGLCACCVVRLNGKIAKACVVLATDGMIVEPIREDLLVKDTVVRLGVPQACLFDTREDPSLTASGATRPDDPRGDESCD